MNQQSFNKVLKISEEFFGTESDPEQMPITQESADKLTALHPDTIGYKFDEDSNLIAWAVVVPTSTEVMNKFVNNEISEKQLLYFAAEERKFEAIYVCAAFVLPEYRRRGYAKKLLIEGINKVSQGKNVPLYCWIYSKEGQGLIDSISKDLGQEIITKPSYFDVCLVSEKVYKILTQKKFRNGPLPEEKRKGLVLENIQDKVGKNLPIKFLQFWGGSKNINLPIQEVDLCEKATLEQLSKMNEEVKKVYSPGLFFHIVPGDERVRIANKIPKDRTDRYVKSLADLANTFGGLFEVTPVSILYAKKNFYECFSVTKHNLAEKIKLTSNFEKLVKGARNNVLRNSDDSAEEINRLSIEAALNYSLVRATEEKSEIFEEFEDYIRSYFVKHIPFYEQIKLNFNDIEMTKPKLERSLFFFTGRKGNITQPWQAIGVKGSEGVIFVSQTKLDKYKVGA